MDSVKIGKAIYKLRKENNMTQLNLAEKLYITDKAVSKWERGISMPDITLLTDIAKIFNVDLEKLLLGEIKENDIKGGNMRNFTFYVCENCTNLIMSTAKTQISCCSKKLKPLELKKAEDNERLKVEKIENEYFISSNHEMTKEHYISFVGLLSGESVIIKKQYPEWNLSLRLPSIPHAKLIWYCTNHSLFYQNI